MKHKPMCRTNIICSVVHEGGICPDQNKCDCQPQEKPTHEKNILTDISYEDGMKLVAEGKATLLPTHEIGWEEQFHAQFGDLHESNYLAWKQLQTFIEALLTHQKRELQVEHLKDISQHRGGAFKHGRSVGIKETKDSIVSKLEGLNNTWEDKDLRAAHDKALADAVEVVREV